MNRTRPIRVRPRQQKEKFVLKEVRQALRPDWVAYALTKLTEVTVGTTGTIAEIRANRPADRAALSSRGLLEGTRITLEPTEEADAVAIRVGASITLLPRGLAEHVLVARPAAAPVAVANR